jgi:5'-methylthioadenosine phosphorylase
MVTDYDCWKEEHCTVEEILKVMETNYISVQKVLTYLIPELSKKLPPRTLKNENAVMTAPELISKEKNEEVKVLLK